MLELAADRRENNSCDVAEPKEMADAITRWLVRGGTQTCTGAYAGWRDARTHEPSPDYPEVTGYFLGFVAGTEPEAQADRTVRAAATWLVNRILAMNYLGRPQSPERRVYTFDIAMVAHGLLSYGRLSGGERFIRAGLELVRFLCKHLFADGSLQSLVPPTTTPGTESSWSLRGTRHLLKTVQCLLSAAELGEQQALYVARNLVETAGKWWRAPLRTSPGGSTVSLHALCYAAEGLWVWAQYNTDRNAATLSRSLTKWIWQFQLPNGGFPGFVPTSDRKDALCQSDVLAQAVRLAELHRFSGQNVVAAVSRLCRSVWRDGEECAVIYRPQSDDLHLNCWSSMFAVQALRLHGNARWRLNWNQLV